MNLEDLILEGTAIKRVEEIAKTASASKGNIEKLKSLLAELKAMNATGLVAGQRDSVISSIKASIGGTKKGEKDTKKEEKVKEKENKKFRKKHGI